MKKIRILNFDPGLTTTGWSITDVDLENGALQVSYMGSIFPSGIADRKENQEEVKRYMKRVVTLTVLRSAIVQLLFEFKPDYVVMEDVFFNPSRPSAHAALCMWHCLARMTVRDFYNKAIVTIAPKAAKAAISGDGTSGKINVQQALLSHPKITFRKPEMIAQLTEHCADSIAIGYAFVKNNLPTLRMTHT